MNREQRAYISLGGNQGREVELFRLALQALEALPGVRVAAVSRLYHTEPQGLADQPWFVNQAAALDCTGITPQELLAELLFIEATLGRKRETAPRFGPRPIDLDLLLFEDTVCKTPLLTLPHPRLAERAFVLVPLLELDSGLVLPDGGSCAALLAALPYRVVDDRILQGV